MSGPFMPGDTVRLKSGGPAMTVTEAANDQMGVPTVWTAWFHGTDQKTGAFPMAAVEKVVESQNAPGNWKTA